MSFEANAVSGVVMRYLTTIESLSGLTAVCFASGGAGVVVAQRYNIFGIGVRAPAIGVVAGNYISGVLVPVVMQGPITVTASGLLASGADNRPLYLGSGGLIISQSGFVDGASSGHGAQPTDQASGMSGIYVQSLGVSISGGIWVQPGGIRSGLFSGGLTQY